MAIGAIPWLETATKATNILPWQSPPDAFPKPSYQIAGPGCIKHLCDSRLMKCARIAIDTEGPAEDPWCLTFSTKPGEAWLIRAGDHGALDDLRLFLARTEPLVIMHHSLHDLPVLRAMGVDVLGMGLRVADTMVMAYDLQTLPRGLKPLAQRLAGIQMQDYEDVIVAPRLRELEQQAEQEIEQGTTTSTHTAKGKLRKKPLVTYTEHAKALRRAVRLQKDGDRLARLVEVLKAEPPRVEPDKPAHRDYACRDADATLRIYPILAGMLKTEGLIELTSIDHGAIPMLDRMSTIGMPASKPRIEALSAELAETSAGLLDLIRTLTDIPDFNPGSGDQIAAWLECVASSESWGKEWVEFKRSHMTDSRTRVSTDDESLKTWRDRHPAIPIILDWKANEKLRTSYVDKLPGELGKDGRYHPDWRHTSVYTGRLAEWILTFPKATEQGRKVRSLFVAPSGWEFGSADLGQIELRILASESRDPELCDVFWRGADPHVSTASKIFGVPEDQITKDSPYWMQYRYPSKTTNYLVCYGGDEYTLHADLIQNGLNYTLEQAREFIEAWYALYKGVRVYQNEMTAFARRTGYIRDIWGRRRYLPAIYLDDRKLSNEAMRQAGNHPMQAGVAGFVKRAMKRLHYHGLPELRSKHGVGVEPVLQYHDELVVLFESQGGEVVKDTILAAMTADQDKMVVPIVSEWGQAQDWGSL